MITVGLGGAVLMKAIAALLALLMVFNPIRPVSPKDVFSKIPINPIIEQIEKEIEEIIRRNPKDYGSLWEEEYVEERLENIRIGIVSKYTTEVWHRVIEKRPKWEFRDDAEEAFFEFFKQILFEIDVMEIRDRVIQEDDLELNIGDR